MLGLLKQNITVAVNIMLLTGAGMSRNIFAKT